VNKSITAIRGGKRTTPGHRFYPELDWRQAGETQQAGAGSFGKTAGACRLPATSNPASDPDRNSEIRAVTHVDKITVATIRAINKFAVRVFAADICLQAQSAFDPIIQPQ